MSMSMSYTLLNNKFSQANTAWPSFPTVIGVDLAEILGEHMAGAEVGSVPSGVGYGEGCPLSSRLGDLGEHRQLPQRVPGHSPGQKRILAYFEGHRMLPFLPI